MIDADLVSVVTCTNATTADAPITPGSGYTQEQANIWAQIEALTVQLNTLLDKAENLHTVTQTQRESYAIGVNAFNTALAAAIEAANQGNPADTATLWAWNQSLEIQRLLIESKSAQLDATINEINCIRAQISDLYNQLLATVHPEPQPAPVAPE